MLKMVRRAVGPEVPVIAIGGIKPENVKEVSTFVSQKSIKGRKDNIEPYDSDDRR